MSPLARSSFWLASLFVPGWSQLIACRLSAIGWLLAGGAAWSLVVAALLTDLALLPALGVAGLLHVLCATRAYRLAQALSSKL